MPVLWEGEIRFSRRRLIQGAASCVLLSGGLALLSGCGLVPNPTSPTGGTVRRIGWLSPSAGLDAFRQGLRDLGWIEGANVVVEYRWAEVVQALDDLATELIGLNVEVLVASGPAIPGAIRATSTTTIPVVFLNAGADAASFGPSSARREGNFTGFSALSTTLAVKRLELLKEAIPGLKRVAVLSEPEITVTRQYLAAAEPGAHALGLELVVLQARRSDDLDGVFQAARTERAEALMTFDGPLVFAERQRIVALAAGSGLPAIYGPRQFAEAGGLMAYGADNLYQFQRAATYVDKILRGARAGDLPIEQPSRFSFVVNLKAAQALGLTIPQSVLLQATEVLQ